MGDGATVSSNRELLAANLRNKTARALLKHIGDTADGAAITGLVSDAAAARLVAIERELDRADADLA